MISRRFRLRGIILPQHHTPCPKPTPIGLTIAGSDSGGGAGIQADLKTFSALGVYGASVITALTAQNTWAVTAVLNTPAEMVTAQIQAVLTDLNVAAIKIGMLSSPEIIAAVANEIQQLRIPVVLDPVMIAKSGDALLQQNAIDSLRSRLLPCATILTPNLPEAATLLDCAAAQNEAEMQAQGEALLKLGASAVLMKGGHASGAQCTDLLLSRDLPMLRLSSERVSTRNTHGTGCTLSAAIAAQLARGAALDEAVTLAHRYLNHAIHAADSLQIGQGCGPVHHFHGIWK
jgi:hydroxymethylpyrimidine/phosphomethylpyrimidine kinase